MWDTICINTFVSSAVTELTTNSRHTTASAEDHNQSKYTNLLYRVVFQSIAVETSGVIGPATWDFLNSPSLLMTHHTGPL